MSAFAFGSLYLAVLLLPGYALLRTLSIKTPPLFLCIAASYTLFAIGFITANHFSLSASNFTTTILCITALSAIYVGIAYFKKKLAPHSWLATVVIFGVSGLYQIVFGTFTEIPADIYAHLERYQSALDHIQSNTLGKALPWKDLLLQKSGVFYHLLATVSSYTKPDIEHFITVADFINRSLFLCAVFQLSKQIFNHSKHTTAIAGATCLFVTLHMGISVFAFVRYYSLAPTMLNMVIYMAAIWVFLRTLDQKKGLSGYTAIVLIPLFAIAAASIHVQETLFIATMVGLMSLAAALSILRVVPITIELSKTQLRTTVGLCIVGGLSFILLYYYSHLNLNRAVNAHWKLWEFGKGWGVLPDITTINPSKELSETLTWWGVFIYGLFVLNIRRYTRNLFLMAGMLSPIVTIFNPFFVDIFMRHYSSTTLWRLAYIIPIHFVAGDLIIHYLRQLKSELIGQKIVAGGCIALMVGLLSPYFMNWQGLSYSRAPTLKPTQTGIGYAHAAELVNFLETIEPAKKILTDPMTGYFVSATTHHHSARRKFFRDFRFKHFTFDDYSNSPLARYRGYLLILNQRDYPRSEVGKLSNHWARNQWQFIKSYYRDPLPQHLKNNAQRFSKIWTGSGFEVYEIL